MTKRQHYEPKNNTLADDFFPDTFGSAGFTKLEQIVQLGLTKEGKGKKFCPYIGCDIADMKITLQDVSRGGAVTEIYARTPSNKHGHTEDDLEPGVGNIITFAPTRAGKGAGQIVMNLLMWKGSALILDVKGENYLRSAAFRADTLRQTVLRFAPFEDFTHIWNPIMAIRSVENWAESTWKERCLEEEDARYLANLVISTSGSKNDVFWEDQAKSLLVGLLLYVRTAELTASVECSENEYKQQLLRERSMREVTRLVTLENDSFNSLLIEMSNSTRMLVKQVGTSFQNYLSQGESKLGNSIKSMLHKQIEVWAYERVHRATYESSGQGEEPNPNQFSFSQMRDGNTSLYIIVPPEYLSEYCSVLRVVVGSAIRELKDSYKQSKQNPDQAETPPVLFLLDEFAQLAHMSPIEDGLSYLAGYGVRFWFFLQDIEQLKSNYPSSWQSFLANTDIKCFFGVNDIYTAQLVSETAGTCTVNNSSLTKPMEGQAANTLTSGYTARRLITPEEVMNMPGDKQIVFFRGLKPMYLNLPKYYEFEYLRKQSELPPPHDVNFI